MDFGASMRVRICGLITMRRAGLILAATMLMALGPAARAQTFTGLGVLAGDSSSSATAVSGDGTTVVGYCPDVNGAPHGFVWRRETGMSSISTDIRSPQGVSFDGAVVVGYYGGAWRWTSSGGFTTLPTLGSTLAQAWGISADGSVIVGTSSLCTSCSVRVVGPQPVPSPLGPSTEAGLAPMPVASAGTEWWLSEAAVRAAAPVHSVGRARVG